MALKDILVHIDNTLRCGDRLDTALELARAHDAHLIGLHIEPRPRIPEYLRTQIPDDLMTQQARLSRDAAERLRHMFEEHIQRAGVAGEWRCVEGDVLPMLSLHGRYADLVVAGQSDPSGRDAGDDPGVPDHAILAIGRPVLVIPYGDPVPVIGERVLVAWDASRLATRAVADALPLLERAKHVIVVAVDPKIGEGDRGHGAIPSADICLHLARHGIPAEAQSLFAEDLNVGRALLLRAEEEGVDLIVCGAYGHARWREIVLGGVTRHLLAHMTVPVLMSH